MENKDNPYTDLRSDPSADHTNKPEIDLSKFNIVVVIPAYNEERFIGSVILKILRYPVKIVVIDDGSTDETASIAKAAGVDVIILSKNHGKGAALNVGFINARKLNPDAIVTIDADFQHLPEELPCIVRPILTQQADICIGSRYLEDTSNTPIGRRIGHKLINLATSVPTGIKLSDSQSGYRAFSARAYNIIDFKSNGFAVESEMQFLAQEHDLKVVEVPITIRYTDKAKRPMLKQGTIVLNGILRLIGQYRPLLYFGVPGLILLVSCIGLGIIVVQRYIQTQQLAVGYGLITVLLEIAGLLSLSTGFTLHSIRSLLIELNEGTNKNC